MSRRLARWPSRVLLPVLLAGLLLIPACGDGDDPVGPGGTPGDVRVFIIDPPQEEVWTAVNDTLTFTASVSDAVQVLPDRTVRWRSDRDGDLGTTRTDSAGQARLGPVLLGPGVHRLTATVVRDLQVLAVDLATIHHVLPARVRILAAEASRDGVALRFTANREDRFQFYDVRRWVDDQSFDQGERVLQIFAREDTTAIDPLPPLAQTVHYAVSVVDDGALTAPSPPWSLHEPNGPILPFLPWDVAAHPDLPLVYVLDRASPTSHLVAMNHEDLTVVASRDLEHGACQYLDVGDGGQGVEVYLSRADDGISVLDPLTLAERAHVTMGYGAGSVAIGTDGTVFVSLGTNDFSVSPVRAYARAGWDLLAEGGHHDWGRLEPIPGTGGLLEVSMGSSPSALAHHAWDAAGQTLTWTYLDVPDGAWIAHKVFRIDPTGTYAVTHHWGSVFAADATGAHLGNLPRGASQFTDYAFSPDGAIIHAGVSDARHARAFTFPDLAPTTGVSLRGIPWKMVRVGHWLVALSRPEPGAERVGLDVVRVAGP